MLGCVGLCLVLSCIKVKLSWVKLVLSQSWLGHTQVKLG